MIAIGAFVVLICKNQKRKNIAEIIIGLGLLFIGLKFMSDVIKPFAEAEDSVFKTALLFWARIPYWVY